MGEWCKYPDVIKNWSKSEHLINNQEIYHDRHNIDPIKPFTTRKVIMIKFVLYAMIDLHSINKTKSWFNLKEIKEMIDKKRTLYLKFIEWKVNHLVEKVKLNKFDNSSKNYDVQRIIAADIQRNKKNLNKELNLSYSDLYTAIAQLYPVFIAQKMYVRKLDYENVNEPLATSPTKLYYLNKDGMELLKKVKTDLYLI